MELFYISNVSSCLSVRCIKKGILKERMVSVNYKRAGFCSKSGSGYIVNKERKRALLNPQLVGIPEMSFRYKPDGSATE
jgi:hypothetical protein